MRLRDHHKSMDLAATHSLDKMSQAQHSCKTTARDEKGMGAAITYYLGCDKHNRIKMILQRHGLSNYSQSRLNVASTMEL